MTIGDTVYVWWYGKVVQGMIVENDETTPLLASMMVVRIPVLGMTASALYTPAHVYQSETDALAAHQEIANASNGAINTIRREETPTPQQKSTCEVLFEAEKRIQAFKEAHWDHERGHIRVDALEEFYQLWRTAIAEKMGYHDPKDHPYVPKFNGWSPVKPKPIAPVIENAIKEIKQAKVETKQPKREIKKVKYTQLAIWD